MKRNKTLTILLTLVMALSFLSNIAIAEAQEITFVDMPAEGFWSTASLKAAVANNLIGGFVIGGKNYIKPDDPLTRAQMATIINRAFASKYTAPLTGVKDVPTGEWFYMDMQKALKMGTLALDTYMRPNDNVTREEAFTILSRAFKMELGSATDLVKFSDASSVSDWAVSSVGAIVKAGYVGGSSGNKLNPRANMTRAEFAAMMDRLIKEYITTSGIVKKIASGNIMINTGGVSLENVTVTGDLILGDGVDGGTVVLNNVTIQGKTIIRSGKIIIGGTGLGENPIGKETVKATSIEVGQMLSSSILSGTFKNSSNQVVSGVSEWTAPKTIVNASGQFGWIFTPNNTTTYNVITGNVSVIANAIVKSNPLVDTAVSSTPLKFGQTLSESSLYGSFKNSSGQKVTGKLSWTTPNYVVQAPGYYDWTFTPDETTRYYVITGTVKLDATHRDFSGGTGTKEDPYLVASEYQLDKVRNHLDKHFKQTKGLNLSVGGWQSGEGWVPIGTLSQQFTGSYDGNGMGIRGPVINRVNGEVQGLFGAISQQAELSNIELVEAKVNARKYVGGLVGLSYGKVSNCSIDYYDWMNETKWVIEGQSYVGGLVGFNAGTIDECESAIYSVRGNTAIGGIAGVNISDGIITNSINRSNVRGAENIGGLVGVNSVNSSIENSKTVDANIWGEKNAGGSVGLNQGNLYHCSSEKTTVRDDWDKESVGTENIGGLVGWNSGNIEKCYTTKVKTRAAKNYGGLVGYNTSHITMSFVQDGEISGRLDWKNEYLYEGEYAGGLVGLNDGNIYNSYASGGYVLAENYMGGLVGKSENNTIITNCYATCLIRSPWISGTQHKAGLVGYNDATITNCFYDKETTKRDDKGKGYPKTTAEMTTKTTFTTGTTWDFSGTWTIKESAPKSYPYFQWQGTDNIPYPETK